MPLACVMELTSSSVATLSAVMELTSSSVATFSAAIRSNGIRCGQRRFIQQVAASSHLTASSCQHTSTSRSFGCQPLLQRASSQIRCALAREGATTTDIAAPPATSAQHILEGAARHGASTAIIDPSGASHSYAALLAASSAIADKLCAVPSSTSSDNSTASTNGAPAALHSLAPGSRLGLFSKPGADFVASLWGAWLAGHVAVPLCTSHPAAELLYVLQNSEASLVIGPEESRQLLQPIADELGIPFILAPAVSDLAPAASAETSPLPQAKELAGSPKGALFIYTSGTTGRPKGVVHSHAGLAAQADMLVDAWEYRGTDRFLHVLPLHHVHGVMNAMLAPLSSGAAVEFMPKFNPVHVWARLRKSYPLNAPPARDAITVFTGVPTHYVRLIQVYDTMSPEDQEASSYAASQMRLMMCGSAACPEPVMVRWEEITGQRLLERYGMTEFGMGLANPLHGERKIGCVGFPLKGVKTKIDFPSQDGEADESSGGELLISSPGMFREYWKRPEANAEAFDEEGYFKTGDTVAVDSDGYYKILGRTSVDIIKMGGYKLSALEIEAILLEHPQIGECAVLGVPDADYGEAVAAVLCSPEGAQVPELRELKKWCMEKMAHYKIPTKLRVMESLPRNAMGKVNKKDLKRQLFQEVTQ